MRGPASASVPRLAWPVAVLVGLLVAGGLAGVAWEALWSAPSGVALDGTFVLDGPGARSAFDATGLFVLVSAVVGLVAGVLVGWVTRRDELLVLAVAVAGSAGATVLMYAVGHLLGPADPAPLAAAAEDFAPLVDDLALAGKAPWLVLTAAVLAGLVVTFLGFGRRPDDADEATHDDTGGRHLDWRARPAGPVPPGPEESVGSGPPPDPRHVPPGGR